MYSTPLVYLGGPISNLSYAEAVDWREYASKSFASWDMKTASPMRYKTYLKPENKIADVYERHPLSSLVGINLRDLNDVRRCDGLLINFLGAKRVSIGTCIEIGMATALNKPVVIAMEDGQSGYDQLLESFGEVKNPHDHAMVRAANLVVTTLDEAIECLGSILAVDLPSVGVHDAPKSHPELTLPRVRVLECFNLDVHGMD